MARGINKVIIIGNFGKDPESKATQGSGMVANFSVATDESYKDKQTGQMVPKSEWHRIVAFGKLAEICSQYLNKGSKVYIEGRLRTRKWQAQDGTDRYTTEIVANEMQMLDSKSGSGQQQNQPSQQQQPRQQNQPVQQQQPSQLASAAAESVDDFDIPF